MPGCIDFITKEFVSGYYFNDSNDELSNLLIITSRGQVIGQARANLYNEKYKILGLGNGFVGFFFEFPKNVLTQSFDNIKVTPHGSNIPLTLITENPIEDYDIFYSDITSHVAEKAASYNNLIIFNHIPKTGGTSFKKSLVEATNSGNILYHYLSAESCSPEIWEWKFSQHAHKSFNIFAENLIRNNIKLLLGHFGWPECKGFSEIKSIFKNAFCCGFVRSPHHHTLSLYSHMVDLHGYSAPFSEFIELPWTQNYQSTALGIKSIDECNFYLGVTEQMELSCEIFSLLTGISISPHYENTKNDRIQRNEFMLEIDLSTLNRFNELNVLDFHLYDYAIRQLSTLKDALLLK